MGKVMELSNGQKLITLPAYVARILGVTRGDKVDFAVDLKGGRVWIRKAYGKYWRA